ncbi:MAG: hypothetical protein HY784_00680 [Chloroflexi bacterium]|nr:hypothetical protein [Chloroflexota bacterium]
MMRTAARRAALLLAILLLSPACRRPPPPSPTPGSQMRLRAALIEPGIYRLSRADLRQRWTG